MTDGSDETDRPDRSAAWRRLVRGAGAAIPAGIAGCLGDDDEATSTAVAFFEVVGLAPVTPAVEAGDRLDASATVRNTGESANARTIEVRVDGDALATRSLSLDPGEETSVEFEVTVPDLDPGEYPYGVHSGDDSTRGTLTVESSAPDEQIPWHRDHDWEPDPQAATDWSNYETTKLHAVNNLMSIDVAPDGRVFYITRGAPPEPQPKFTTYGHGTAEVGWVDPDGGHGVVLERRVQVGSLEQQEGVPARELGGQGVALDPDFSENGYVYVYYTPAADEREDLESPYDQFHDSTTTMGYMVVSRFNFANGRLLEATEDELIRIPDQHDSCCHRGGNLQFGPDGHLYVTTGDNGGGPGIDDRRSSHPTGDASRTSGNTADLRGSVLRIRPTEEDGNGPDTWYNPNGLYEIPDYNLKEAHERKTGEEYSVDEFCPEIYAMGFRNPFIASVDEHTGGLFVGDYGPGSQWGTDTGPVGFATWHLICEPAFAGWPFFKAYYPYRRDGDETDGPGQPFWPDNLRNDSRNNTGIEELPPVTPATVWQGQDYGQYEGRPDEYVEGPAWLDMPRPGEVSWPDVDTGGSANAGPAYRYSESFGETAFDPYFEGTQFLMAPWGPNGWIGYMDIGRDDGSVDIQEFMPDHGWRFPTEMKFGPDGRLFVMNYSHRNEGSNYLEGGLYMVEYTG